MALALIAAPLYFVQGGGWNQNTRLALTRAICERGTLSIDAYLGRPIGSRTTGDFSQGPDKRHFADKSPGPSWLAVPIYLVLDSMLDGDPGPYSSRVDKLAHWTIVLLLGGLTAAAGLALLALLADLPPWWAVALTLGWGLGTMALPYATLFFNHQIAASLSIMAFALVATGERDAGHGRWLLAGHLLGWAAICDYACLATCLGVGLLLIWRTRKVAAGAVLVAGFLPPVLAFMAYNAHCFGGPLTLGYQMESHHVWEDLAGTSVGFSAPRLDKLYEVTLGRYRGLLWGSPFLALAPIGLWVGRHGARRERLLTCAFVGGAFLTYNAAFVYWHAGHAAGPRFLVPALPFLVLMLAPLSGRWRQAALPLIALSVALMLATTAVDPQVPGGHHKDTQGVLEHHGQPPQHYADPWFDFTLPRLWRGELGTHAQGYEAVLPLPPDAAASWNWGERLGLPGLLQLLPLLLLWAAVVWATCSPDPAPDA